ncbi:MAG: aminoglycoside phosphotransferase family protein [Anaerolineae bacterium]|nr:aminoglycoside phosphotransferase family protein [Anaerolineae bacterium]
MLPVIHTWEEWGRVFTNVSQWEAAVREICRREAIPVNDIEAGFPGTNAVFVVDQAYVVKIYAPFCREDFELERELYSLLASIGNFPVPHLMAQGILEDHIDWPYIVMNFIPGQPIAEVRAQIPKQNLNKIAGTLGRAVRQLHKIPLDVITSLDTSLEGWQKFLQQQRDKVVVANQQQHVLPPELIVEIPAFLDACLPELSTSPLVLLNGDLTQDHVLLVQNTNQWRISGLIDFADSLIGPREYEWIALWFGALDRNFDELQCFMHQYDPALSLDEAFFQRAMAFTFLHEFGAEIIAWVLGRIGNPEITSLAELGAVLWEG